MNDVASGIEPSGTGPLSWRDVYKAVGESEGRVIQSIKDAVGPLTQQGQDHELRLRLIEQAVAPLAVKAAAVDAELVAVKATATATATTVQGFIAREGGIFATLGAGKTLVVVGMSVMGFIVAAADFIARISS